MMAEEPTMTRLTPQVLEILHKPVFEGDPMTLRTVLNAFAALGDGGAVHPRNVQNMTGLCPAECADISKAVNMVLSLTNL
jgi:hypothetical protein